MCGKSDKVKSEVELLLDIYNILVNLLLTFCDIVKEVLYWDIVKVELLAKKVKS